nr:hypothetical protein LVJ77_04365 [Conchiformibius kuhniae]
MKFQSALAALLLVVSLPALAADFNPVKGSYGTWYGTDNHALNIDAKGIGHIAEAPKRCRQKKNGFIHERVDISGKQLLKDIKTSMEYSDDKDISQLEALIDPKRTYMRLNGALSCGDGLQSFIYVNDKVSIGMLAAPEDFYYILIKR